MWPFSRKIERAEIIECDETAALETIEVRDIRQYLVDEYERAANLKAHCDELTAKIDAADVIEAKYQAALITLDEYAIRLKRQEDEIDALNRKVEKANEAARGERDAANILRIKLNRADPSNVAKETRKLISEMLMAAKGNMSKRRAANIALGVEPVDSSQE